MITVTDRIGEAIAAVERGERVDWRKLADLQALDLAHAGQQYAQESAIQDAAFDDAARQLVEKAISP